MNQIVNRRAIAFAFSYSGRRPVSTKGLKLQAIIDANALKIVPKSECLLPAECVILWIFRLLCG